MDMLLSSRCLFYDVSERVASGATYTTGVFFHDSGLHADCYTMKQRPTGESGDIVYFYGKVTGGISGPKQTMRERDLPISIKSEFLKFLRDPEYRGCRM